MSYHLVLPLIVPLFGALLVLLVRQELRIAGRAALIALLLNLAYAIWLLAVVAADGRQVVQVGGWPADDGLTLVADGLSSGLLALAGLLVLATFFAGLAAGEALEIRAQPPDPQQEGSPAEQAAPQQPGQRTDQQGAWFVGPLLLLLTGCNGVAIAGDLFNMAIWLELLLLAGAGLLLAEGGRRVLASGLAYLALNLVGSMCLLVGCGLVYGLAGTLNFAQIGARLGLLERPGLATVLASLFVVAGGTKAASVAFFFWRVGSDERPPLAAVSIASGLLASMSLVLLCRVAGLVFPEDLPILAPLLRLLAGLLLLLGAWGALAQHHVRRILAFLLLGQSGMLLLGLGLANPAGLAAAALVVLYDMLALGALFALAGGIEEQCGTGDIRRLGDLAHRQPLLALLWFVALLSLAGLPPPGGFFGRFALLHATLNQQAYASTVVVVVAHLLLLVPLLRVWQQVFWQRQPPGEAPPRRSTGRALLPGALLVGALCLGSLAIGPVAGYTRLAAEQALDLAGYMRDVTSSLPVVEP